MEGLVGLFGLGFVGYLVRNFVKGYRDEINQHKINRNACGSASFMSPQESEKFKLSENEFFGKHLFLGKSLFNEKTYFMFHLKEPGHLITVAPTRAGKGTSQIIPNLLQYNGSMVVMDIKGENYDLTATARKQDVYWFKKGKETKRDKSLVYRFAPDDDLEKYFPYPDDIGAIHHPGELKEPIHFATPYEWEETYTTHRWNPLHFIRYGTSDEYEDALKVAELIIEPGEKGESSYWEQEAQNLLAAFIMHVLADSEPAKRHLGQVRHLLTQSPESFDATLAEMQDSPNLAVGRIANSFLQKADKERSGILSTAQSKTSIWDSQKVIHATSSNHIMLNQLRDASQRMTLYICIPPDKLTIYKPLLRLMMGISILIMTRKHPASLPAPVVFLMDEMPALGRMEAIEKGMGYLAGYNVRLWLFAQDLNQIESIYGQNVAASLFSNCAARCFFGVNDFKTAKLVSDMIGNETIRVTSRSGKLMDFSFEENENKSLKGRPLLTPDEVMMIHPTKMLTLMLGERPVILEKHFYYKDESMMKEVGSWGNQLTT